MGNIPESGKRTKLFFAVAIVSMVLSIFQLLRIDISPASKSLASSENSWGSVFLLFAVALIAGVAYRISEWKPNPSVERIKKREPSPAFRLVPGLRSSRGVGIRRRFRS